MKQKDCNIKGFLYNVAIIGGGIGGLMTAYQLSKNGVKNIIIIDKGNTLENRQCPASNTQKCMHCKTCAITCGYAGAGAHSDGKFNLGTSYGGTLGEELGNDTAMKYINKVDSILEEFATEYPKMYHSNEELKLKCTQNNLTLLDMNVRHLGTDKNFITMKQLISYLSGIITMISNQECIDITEEDTLFYGTNCFKISLANTSDYFLAEKVVVSTGRSGSSFVKTLCQSYNIPIQSNNVDIGVRVEMKDSIWKEFSSKIYEPKILYRSKTFDDKCRMFCFNQGGIVTTENNNGVITANGHSYADKDKKTDNCNFAILSSIHFDGDFNKPTEYAENIAKNMNFAGEGNIIVQRFGDLIRGRRSTQKRIESGTVIPTIKAFPGDISIVMPYRPLTNIIETIYALNKVAPGTANDDTLLYGCENKYYSLKPHHDKSFMITDGIYLIGDGSGICRGLSQSAAMGLYVADKISSACFNSPITEEQSNENILS